MPPILCDSCATSRALIVRPATGIRLCKLCFLAAFEADVHATITKYALFTPGETVAIGASGGKDSTVLASVLKTLNERYDYGVKFILLSIDEGIKGYRDDSLETVKRNADQYDMELCILGYAELYGWTMDQVVEQVGKKGNCTYCGVFRRQALDRGAAKLKVDHVVTGHNADDVAETVLMNMLRGDLARLARTAGIVTSTVLSGGTGGGLVGTIKRSKPLKYAFEKEIALYAHHKKLDYFSTECIYSPEAFRGSARALIKDLERIRPRSILDIVQSGEDMAQLVPESKRGAASSMDQADEGVNGCGSGGGGRAAGGEMVDMERKLRQDKEAGANEVDILAKLNNIKVRQPETGGVTVNAKTLGECIKCGYMSSQAECKACMLLEGLNKHRPQIAIQTDDILDEDLPITTERQLDTIAAVKA